MSSHILDPKFQTDSATTVTFFTPTLLQMFSVRFNIKFNVREQLFIQLNTPRFTHNRYLRHYLSQVTNYPSICRPSALLDERVVHNNLSPNSPLFLEFDQARILRFESGCHLGFKARVNIHKYIDQFLTSTIGKGIISSKFLRIFCKWART